MKMKHKHMTDIVCSEHKVSLDELETNSTIKNIEDLYRGMNDFKKGYQPRTNLVKDEKGLFGYRLPQNFGYVKEPFLSAIELHCVNDVRRIEIHTAEPLVPEPSAFEVEIAI
jgi:hypothetical protein